MDYFCGMGKRVKVLHGLTIIVIIAFCMVQCYWLYNRYEAELISYEDKVYDTVLDVMREDYDVRRSTQSHQICILTNSQMKVSANANQPGLMKMVFDVYVIDMNTYAVKDTTNMNNIVNIYEQQKPKGITKYSFEVANQNNEYNAYDALERFRVNKRSPFNIANIDLLLNKRGLQVKEITLDRADSMVWFPSQMGHTSMFRPSMTV